jgi:hypothetical protein
MWTYTAVRSQEFDFICASVQQHTLLYRLTLSLRKTKVQYGGISALPTTKSILQQFRHSLDLKTYTATYLSNYFRVFQEDVFQDIPSPTIILEPNVHYHTR